MKFLNCCCFPNVFKRKRRQTSPDLIERIYDPEPSADTRLMFTHVDERPSNELSLPSSGEDSSHGEPCECSVCKSESYGTISELSSD